MKQPFRKRVGKYLLGRTLGEGTYAKVKYGEHCETGEPVAIKVLEKAKIIKQEMVEQIQREISIMRQLDHPNIVKLKEVMSSTDKIYIVMELLTGGELFDKIATEGPLKEDEARRIFQELLDALEYCHSQGVYHRDLKPENVLLTASGTAKLSDFGLGALQDQEIGDGLFRTACGTPNYVAPEVLKRKGYAGAPADVWSLGVVLYVMLAGCLPFDEADLGNLFRKIASASYECPPWFTKDEREVLRKILAPDPTQRATLDELRRQPWVMKGFPRRPLLRTPSADEIVPTDLMRPSVMLEDLSKEETERVSKQRRKTLNAFQLINSSLDISAMFEKREDVVKRRTRFTTKTETEILLARLESATVARGGRAERKGNASTRLYVSERPRPLVVQVDVLSVLPGVRMVELAKYSGNSVEFYSFYRWLTTALADIITKKDSQSPKSLRTHIPSASVDFAPSTSASNNDNSATRSRSLDHELSGFTTESSALTTSASVPLPNSASLNRSPSCSPRSPKKSLNAFDMLRRSLDISGIFERKSSTVQKSSYFTSKADPEELLTAIEGAVGAWGGKAKRVDEEESRLLVSICDEFHQLLRVDIELHAMTQGASIVQLNKQEGDDKSFVVFHKALQVALASVTKREDSGLAVAPVAFPTTA